MKQELEQARKLAWWCQSCRFVGMIHCSDPVNCGGMQQIAYEEAAAKYAAILTRKDTGT